MTYIIMVRLEYGASLWSVLQFYRLWPRGGSVAPVRIHVHKYNFCLLELYCRASCISQRFAGADLCWWVQAVCCCSAPCLVATPASSPAPPDEALTHCKCATCVNTVQNKQKKDYLLDCNFIEWGFFVNLLFLFGHRDPAGGIGPAGRTSGCGRLWRDTTKQIDGVRQPTRADGAGRVGGTDLRCVSVWLRRLRGPPVSWAERACCRLDGSRGACRWLAGVTRL